MNVEEKQAWAKNRSIDEIVAMRDQYAVDTPEWREWNYIKAERLEELKPSTKEEIVYFRSEDVAKLPDGLHAVSKLPAIPFYTARRSLLEYNPTQRHPIPYVIVRHKKYYFFILRGSGVGEIRLENKKGMLGGHIGKEDVDDLSLNKTILNGLKRELEEEAGITEELIESIELKGTLKSDQGVDKDHLGLIYEIRLLTKDIQSREEELSGIWLHEKELVEHAPAFESWSKLIYDMWLKK